MSFFGFKSNKEKEAEIKSERKDNLIAEVNSLQQQIGKLNNQIEEKENSLKLLEGKLRDIENRINFSICEKAHIENVVDADISIVWKDSPTIEEMREAIKLFNITRSRYSIVKEWMDKYENDLDSIKKNIDTYMREHHEELRNEIIHELYQRASNCESSMLRQLSSFVENADIEQIRNQLKIHKHIIQQGLTITNGDSVIKYSHHPIYRMCEDFIQLNITNIVKDMKFSDWETIKMKASTLISNVNSLLLSYTSTTFDEDYLNSVYNYLEAKFLVVQKQEIEKEKAREEREAQREYERAIKKAQKDEEKVQEALEKKKRELAEEQTQEKILKLNEQIKELEKALLEAKELRERAMSMAQQTKSGYVYIISNIGSFGRNIYKIGMTRRLDPMERIIELSNASVPFPFDVHTFIFSNNAPALEAELHRVFEDRKVNTVNYRKEYYRVTLDEIKTVIKEKGIHAEFVEEPDAFQYRESQIDTRIKVLQQGQ